MPMSTAAQAHTFDHEGVRALAGGGATLQEVRRAKRRESRSRVYDESSAVCEVTPRDHEGVAGPDPSDRPPLEMVRC